MILRPRFSATFDTTFAIGTNIRLVLPIVEVPIVEIQLGDAVTGDFVEEPPVRWGASICVAVPVRGD